MRRCSTVSFCLAAIALGLPGLASQPALGQGKLLRWKLKTGQQFNLVMTQNMTQSISGGGVQDLEIPMQMTFAMSWTVEQAAEDRFQIVQTIDRVQMEAKSAIMNVSFDSDSKAELSGIAAQLQKTLQPLIGAKIRQTMNARGEVTDVQFPPGALTGLAGNPMTQQFSEDGIKQMFAQSSVVFPEAPLQAGESWSTSYESETPMGQVKTDNVYRYEGTEQVDGQTLDKVHVTITVSLPGDSPAAVLKEQDSSGHLYFDSAAGYLTGSTIQQKMVFEANTGNQQVTQTVDGKIQMKMTPK